MNASQVFSLEKYFRADGFQIKEVKFVIVPVN